MVLVNFMLAWLAGYLILRSVRFVRRRKTGPKPPDPSQGVGAVDEQLRLWTALDDLQLARLLKDAAA
jgi:hypothetical protein